MQRRDTTLFYQRLQNKIAAYIVNNIPTPFGIGELADHVNLSYHHVAEVFRTQYGESLGHAITRARLEKAAMLSAYTCLNTGEIADATGFATRHSLSKAFSAHFGFAPGKAGHAILRTDSINAVLDGITSEAHYRHIVQSDFSFSYRTRLVTCGVLMGYTWHLGAVTPPHWQSMPYLDNLFSMSLAGQAKRCIKAFDSVNFTALQGYREFYGIFSETLPPDAHTFDGLIVPVPAGKYLVFNIPAGDREDIKHCITRFRENLVWHKKMFTLHNFFDFVVLHHGPDGGGEYYMLAG